MSREIRHKETESSAEGGEKLVILMRPTLGAADPSVIGYARKKHKTNTSIVGNALLYCELGPTFMLPTGTKTGVLGSVEINEGNLKEINLSIGIGIRKRGRNAQLQPLF